MFFQVPNLIWTEVEDEFINYNFFSMIDTIGSLKRHQFDSV